MHVNMLSVLSNCLHAVSVKLNKHPIALAGSADPALSVDALEKMMEDPTVQKMVYP